MMRRLLAAAATLLLVLPAAAAPHGKVDPILQNKIDLAVRMGLKTLKAGAGGGGGKHKHDAGMLVLLTLVHSGIPEDDARVQTLLKRALNSELASTYTVALIAMSLEELERVKYQWRIQQCAQFLVDNIGPAGETRYGKPTKLPDVDKTVTQAKANVKTKGRSDAHGQVVLGGSGGRTKPKVVNTILVKQQREGPKEHDHSNMQYAALGLRACYDAGIRFEPGLIKKVDQWWRNAQKETKDARAEPLQVDPPHARLRGRSASTRAVMVFKAAPAGWGYTKGGGKGAHGGIKGSMTAGAVGALCITNYLLGKDWHQDKDVLEGLQWISKNFSVTENPGVGEKHYLYYMYGLERAGMLYGTETIGSHKWYTEGAEALLALQKAGGGWGSNNDTCFVILFLTRATRALVFTG